MKTLQWLIMLLLAVHMGGCGFLGGADKQLADAEGDLARGDYGSAVVTLRNLVDGDAGSTAAQLMLARALFLQGDAEAGDRVLKHAVDNGADQAVATEIHARWWLAAGNFQALLDASGDESLPISAERRVYYRARALQGLRRMPEALVLYRELITQKPDSPDLQLRVALAHAFHGRTQQAEAALAKVFELPVPAGEPPVTAEAWLLRATLVQQSGDASEAQVAQDRAIEAAPGQLGAVEQAQLLALAVSRSLNAGDQDRAREYQAQLVKVLPQAPLTRLVAAQIQLLDDNPAAVVGDLQQLLQQQAGNHVVRSLLIAAHLRVESFEQALREAAALTAEAATAPHPAQGLQQVVRSAASQPVGSVERALAKAAALVLLEQPALGRLVLEQALQQHPESLALKTALVQMEVRNGRMSRAVQLAQELAREHPEVRGVRILLAESQAASGDFASAVAGYEAVREEGLTSAQTLALAQLRRRAGVADPGQPLRDWLQQHPDDAAIRLEATAALQQNGDHATAIRELERVLRDAGQNQPVRVIALNNLAVLYAGSGDRRALETARRAYQLAPTAPAVLDTYGWILDEQGQFEEALPLLRAAAEGAPASPEVRYHYAAALARSGEREAARLLLGDVLEAQEVFEGRDEAERLLLALRGE